MNNKNAHVDILYAMSLTAELKKQPLPFSVRLNFLGLSVLDEDEAGFFPPLPAESTVFVREVCLCLANQPVVSARSVCLPDDAYWRGVLDCGISSLGAQLFGGGMSHLHRSPFVLMELSATHRLVMPFTSRTCTARRSVFDAASRHLLLTECFLPALADIIL